MWLDEALIAENLVDPGRGTLDPLINLQTAPIGWVAALRGLVALAGRDEIVLRLFPFLAGLATVAVVWLAARRLAGPTTAGYAAAIAALSPLLIRYGDELKPYASDALLAALAIWLTLRFLDRPDVRRGAVLVAGGLVIVAFSVPGLFMMCGAAVAVFLTRDAGTPTRRLAFVAAALPVWAGLFAILYFRYYAANQSVLIDALTPYEGFGLAFALSIRTFLGAALVGREVEVVFPAGTVGILSLVAAAGGVALLLRHRARWLAVAGPLLGFAAVYAVGRWPLNTRVLLWCLPSVVLMTAVALDELRRRLPARAGPTLRAALPLILLIPAGWQALTTAVDPPRREDTPAAIAVLVERAARTDAADTPGVVVTGHAGPACRFYSAGAPERWECEIPGYRVVVAEWRRSMDPRAVAEGIAAEAELAARELAGGGWVLIAGSDNMRRRTSDAVEERGFAIAERHAFEGVDLVRVQPRAAAEGPPEGGA